MTVATATEMPGVLTPPRADAPPENGATAKGAEVSRPGVFPATPDEARQREAKERQNRINELLDAAKAARREGGDGNTMLGIVKSLQEQGTLGTNAPHEDYVPPKPGTIVGTEESFKGPADPQNRFLPVGSVQPAGGEGDSLTVEEQGSDLTAGLTNIPTEPAYYKTHLGYLGRAIARNYHKLRPRVVSMTSMIGNSRLIQKGRELAYYIGKAHDDRIREEKERANRRAAEKAARKNIQQSTGQQKT